jgi:protoporphyrinogen/coproporphyrinogen III oxidase
MKQVAIVGGGLAGLAVAHALVKRTDGSTPVQVSVFESEPRAGGLLRTELVDGFLCEHGPSGFLDNAPGTLALVDDLGLTARLQPSHDHARRRLVYRRGRLREIPASPLALVTSRVLSPPGLLRLMAEPIIPRHLLDEESVHAFAARRFGGEAADVLGDVMVAGVFAGDSRQLSLRACFPAAWQMEADHGSLVRALIARRRVTSPDPPTMAGKLASFRSGVGELIDALVTTLGPHVQTSMGVRRLQRASDVGAYDLTLSDGRTLRADALVLAGGAASAAQLLDEIDPAATALLTEIPCAPMVAMCLGYERSAVGHPLDSFGFLAPRIAGMRLLGVLFESSIFPDRAPPGRVLLRVMLGGATDPDVVDLDDERLLARVRAELRTTLQVSGTPRMVRVIRHRAAIPQYVLGHRRRLAQLDEILSRAPGLFVGGHAFRGVGINACIADARVVAERVLASLAARVAA